MKTYSHDYTKVAAAESHLYAAQQLNAHDGVVESCYDPDHKYDIHFENR